MGERERIKQLLSRESGGGRATARGWVRTARHGKGVSFLEVSDGSCFAGIQAVVDPGIANYEEVKTIRTGCAVEISGSSPGFS